MDRTALIYKVLSGTAGEAEKAELEKWISESDENRTEYGDIRLLWGHSNEADSDRSHFYDGLFQIKTRMHRKRHHRKRKKMVMASSILMAGFVIAFWLLYSGSGRESNRYHKFENASLADIITALEKDYDIRIEVEQRKILTCRFTGTFYNDPVEDIIQAVSGSLDLAFDRRDGEYKLTGSGCWPVVSDQ